MLLEEKTPQYKGEVSIFKKKQNINIALLQTHTTHIQRNKLSDKFTRRERAFYNMYMKKNNGEDLAKLSEHQFPLELGGDQLYNDIETDDMNELFENDQYTSELFGQSIKVELNMNVKQKSAKRKVMEYS